MNQAKARQRLSQIARRMKEIEKQSAALSIEQSRLTKERDALSPTSAQALDPKRNQSFGTLWAMTEELRKAGECTVMDIAHNRAMNRITVHRVLRRLISMGYVLRKERGIYALPPRDFIHAHEEFEKSRSAK